VAQVQRIKVLQYTTADLSCADPSACPFPGAGVGAGLYAPSLTHMRRGYIIRGLRFAFYFN
jgi:hypothetical protein